ncbi:glycosyltransferase family 10 domain-containing protein [Polynucleobacter sp. MWH-Braz-FAM2G]|uniref:glycosyltransferase family 10 domain-containing protein n=1 Tax=Polynucleobacter sp. MWH-Braz-FAM2G TaxID=1855883 RepID=UPI001BFE9F03|nr:glycosyltransferase family 10 [Polynucleobacter sp. MWH-Braz-FAM2G]QWD91099.1 hypothetical protein FD973_01805 [Polynucleobacter sp. MWH-Braz-FAM2G]
MKIAFVVPPFFKKGRIFAEHDLVANRDDCLRPFIELHKALAQEGIILATADELPICEADAVLCLNMPQYDHLMWQKVVERGIPVHVIALESEYIHPLNADPTLIARCTTIFTYRDDVVDGVKFQSIRFAQQLRPPLRRPWVGRKFACMVSGNKASSHPNELYSRRLELIRWYDKHHQDMFDLFGTDWEVPAPSNLCMRVVRRLPVLKNLMAPKLRVYRGTISQKLDTLAGYRFNFCYENFNSPEGWITEKIFDAMFAGCVPIYWGPNNISYHIPASCYIDASKLSEPQAIHEQLMSLDDAQCNGIIESIESYLRSDLAAKFSVETFVKKVVQRLQMVSGK